MLVYTSCSTEELESAESSEIERLKQNIKDLEKQNSIQKQMMSYLLRKNDSIKEKIIIENRHDVPFAVIEHVPVFPGCTGTREEKANCLSKSIRQNLLKNFNVDLAKTLNLTKGKKKIYVHFRINEEGKVVDVKVRAPHPKLTEEAKRIVKLLPKMKPGKQRGKAVSMKYAVPISFEIE